MMYAVLLQAAVYLLQVPCARLIEVGEETEYVLNRPEFDGLDKEKLKQFWQ